MGDGRPTCNRVLTSGSVGMGIPTGIPVGIPVGMGWVWGLKCHPHGSPMPYCSTLKHILLLWRDVCRAVFVNRESGTDLHGSAGAERRLPGLLDERSASHCHLQQQRALGLEELPGHRGSSRLH